MSNEAATPRIVLLQYGSHARFAPLPTFDPDCLVAQTYMRFAKVPYEEKNCNNPGASPVNKLPVLSVNEAKTVIHTDIFSELKTMGYDLDASLQEHEKLDAEAWKSLVQHRLHISQLYNWWAEPSNYDEVTSMVFSRSMPFPLNFYLPRRYKNGILSQLQSSGYTDAQLVYDEASKCYAALSKRLGQNRFFYGNEPTSLDAVVFGFLATQFIPNFSQRNLHYLISEHANLVDYINRILAAYFSVDKELVVDAEPAQKWLKSVEAEKAAHEAKILDEAGNTPSKWDTSSALSIAFGIGATVLFLATQNAQFIYFTTLLSKRLGGSTKKKPAQQYTPEELEERSKWLGAIDAEQDEETQTNAPAHFKLTDDPDVNPMKSFHRFAPEDDTVQYIGDDGKAYDWDEQYLAEMETGSDIPEDHEDLGEEDRDDDEYDERQ